MSKKQDGYLAAELENNIFLSKVLDIIEHNAIENLVSADTEEQRIRYSSDVRASRRVREEIQSAIRAGDTSKLTRIIPA